MCVCVSVSFVTNADSTSAYLMTCTKKTKYELFIKNLTMKQKLWKCHNFFIVWWEWVELKSSFCFYSLLFYKKKWMRIIQRDCAVFFQDFFFCVASWVLRICNVVCNLKLLWSVFYISFCKELLNGHFKFETKTFNT